jgi:hypothetical protein
MKRSSNFISWLYYLRLPGWNLSLGMHVKQFKNKLIGKILSPYLYLPKRLRARVSYDTRMLVEGLVDVSVEGIDHRDYPDFCDAFISEACWSKSLDLLTDGELERLNEDSSLVYEYVEASLY